jgi:hypothetical protein
VTATDAKQRSIRVNEIRCQPAKIIDAEPAKLIDARYENGDFNNSLAKLSSKLVKGVIDPFVNIDGKGFCIEKTQNFVSRIPKEEISEDIVNMYKYLVATNE